MESTYRRHRHRLVLGGQGRSSDETEGAARVWGATSIALAVVAALALAWSVIVL